MSIQSEITRITNNVQSTIDTIRATGVTVPEGANSDDLPSLAQALATTKQDKLTGTAGQVVGFDAGGNAEAQDAPESGMTQTEADGRYLQLSGGAISGSLIIAPETDSAKAIITFSPKNEASSVPFNNLSASVVQNESGSGLDYVRFAFQTIRAAGGVGVGFCPVSVGNPIEDNDAANKAYVDSKSPKSVSITLPASGWSSNTQTVTVQGVLADETAQLIQPMPAIASQDAYISAGIICSSQAVNQLTFKCSTVPTDDISLYVVITEVRA